MPFRSLGIAAFLICALAGCVREPALPTTPGPTVSATDPGSLEAERGATLVVTGTVGAASPAPGTRPSGIGNPIQKGTLTLIDTGHARFSYDKGSISYTRHAGVKTIAYLCI